MAPWDHDTSAKVISTCHMACNYLTMSPSVETVHAEEIKRERSNDPYTPTTSQEGERA